LRRSAHAGRGISSFEDLEVAASTDIAAPYTPLGEYLSRMLLASVKLSIDVSLTGMAGI
jgi:hypothetical protein